MKHLLMILFSVSLWANFFVVDNGKVIEIVNEPSKKVQIVGSSGKVLKKYKKLSHIKSRYKKHRKKYHKKYHKKSKLRHLRHKASKKYHKKRVKTAKYKKYKRKVNRDLIIIRTSKRLLEFYQNGRWKKNYKIAVGKDGWRVYGKYNIRKKVKWPDWVPTKKIKEENPRLPDIVKGGPRNPLGARALYLGYSAIRIHGTNNPRSVGKAVSHGCFRMRNKDVKELFNMVKIGTPVYIK